MAFGIETLSDVLAILRDSGMDFVIIGDTVVYLEVKSRMFEGDVDLFITNMSPFVEEEKIRSMAEEQGWGFSYTDLGTPRLIIRTKEGDIIVELYENIHDFYIPEEIIREAKKIRIRNVEASILHVEDYLLLKARAGSLEDFEKLSNILRLLETRRYRINQRLLRSHLKFFPEEEQALIASRLENLGLKL